jgi:hypothetical protein
MYVMSVRSSACEETRIEPFFKLLTIPLGVCFALLFELRTLGLVNVGDVCPEFSM